MKIKYNNPKCRINKIEVTDDKINGRGGLVAINRYLSEINMFELFEKLLKGFRRRRDSISLSILIKQILIYFIDGTQKSISGFDNLRGDESYASVLELEQSQLVSSHSVKRFFRKFLSYRQSFILNKILNTLFIWRLSVLSPKIILLDMDTTALNNENAQKREGNSPTYKSFKGFHPQNLTWNGFVIDTVFRRGSAHSNHGEDVGKALRRVVRLIRKRYDENVPILITFDSAYLDEKNLSYLNKKLDIGFICYGKMYPYIKEKIDSVPEDEFNRYSKGKQVWHYYEYKSKPKSWKTEENLRTIFTTCSSDENGQMLLDFSFSDSVLFTNIGCNNKVTNQLKEAGYEDMLGTEKIIESAHMRGKYELCNRSLKDFMLSENLPFKRFGMNSAYYHMMVIAHFLCESYKQDVIEATEISGIKSNCYPTTFRRFFIDFAIQITKTSNTVSMKLRENIYRRLNMKKLWLILNSKKLIPIPIY